MSVIKKQIGDNSWFIGEHLVIGDGVTIGSDTTIRAGTCRIGDGCSIGRGNKVLVEEQFVVGNNGFIGDNNDFTARTIVLGDYLFLDSHTTVGHGGKFSYDSRLFVGNRVMICARTKLNTNYSITIGDDVGIGEYVDVWTHGSFPPILDGFPCSFGPVEIGTHVWLPAKSTVLPNVQIGNNVVIGVNSLVNKDLPSGCFAAGIPAKVLRENIYPHRDKAANREQIEKILEEYDKQAAYKELAASLRYDGDLEIVTCNGRQFDVQNMTIDGELDDVQEDFRDFLRRRGIKFFTGKPFRSILPEGYRRLLDVD